MVGRKGEQQLVLDQIMMLVLLALFVFAILTYINDHANADIYFNRYYASDLASLSEVVLAAPGDVLITYDNIKPGYTAWLSNGEISVSTKAQERPDDAQKRIYRPARIYRGDPRIDSPGSISMRKLGVTYAITDALTTLKMCPVVTPREGPVWLAVDGPLAAEEKDRILSSFASVLKGVKISETEPALRITITLQTGGSPSLAVDPTDKHGAAYACLFQDELAKLSLIPFGEYTLPAESGSQDIRITITTTTDDALKNQHVGWAAAYAVARYLK